MTIICTSILFKNERSMYELPLSIENKDLMIVKNFINYLKNEILYQFQILKADNLTYHSNSEDASEYITKRFDSMLTQIMSIVNMEVLYNNFINDNDNTLKVIAQKNFEWYDNANFRANIKVNISQTGKNKMSKKQIKKLSFEVFENNYIKLYNSFF